MKQIMPQIMRQTAKSKLSSPPPATHVVYALENNCEVVSKLLQILESSQFGKTILKGTLHNDSL